LKDKGEEGICNYSAYVVLSARRTGRQCYQSTVWRTPVECWSGTTAFLPVTAVTTAGRHLTQSVSPTPSQTQSLMSFYSHAFSS